MSDPYGILNQKRQERGIMVNVRGVELRELYTECIECDSEIEQGMFDVMDNTMYMDCPNCHNEMAVWDWYDDWNDPNGNN
jgi:DNA-directed RNA polymerase subunit RPC12/RpoP